MKNIFITLLLCLGFFSSQAQQLKKGEYYFDTDPGVGNGTAFTFTQADSINMIFAAPTVTLPVGFHRVYVRTINTDNVWSHWYDHLFYIKGTPPTPTITIAPKLKKGEYYFDTDPGVGNGTPFTFTQADSINLPIAASVGSLTPGFHKVYVRTQDLNNVWGMSFENLFYVKDTTSNPPPTLTAPVAYMEYFFDAADYGPGQCAPINPFTPMDSVLVSGQVIAEDPLFQSPLSVGQHTLNIRARDLDGKWSMTKSLAFTVCDQPATAAYSYSVSGATVTFTNNSTNSFGTQWIFGDGTTSSQTNVSHTYGNGGSLNVGLISYSGCGNDTVWQVVNLNCVSPTAAFTYTVTNNNVVFSNTSIGGSTYSWNFGDTKSSALQNPNHIYQNTGTYTVSLTVTNGCGSSVFTQTVTTSCVAPVAGFSVQINGFTAVITNTSTNAANFLWNFGDATTNNIDYHPIKQYANPGTYTLKLTVGNGCGGNIYQIPITIACAPPQVSFNTFTDGLGVEVENTSLNGTSWNWDFGDGTASTFKNPGIHTYTTTGTYTISLVATNSCGSQTITNVVSVCTPPNAQYTYTTNGLIINFTNTSTNATSVVWNFGNGYITNFTSPNYTYAATGTYSVCLNTTNSCGTNQYCQNINIACNSLPAPNICMVTVDSLSINNEIYWEKSLYLMADSFIVYREVSTNVFTRIGAVSKNAFSMYTDTNRSIGPANGDPNLTAYKYKLQIRDTCGNYSALSLWHQTIFVQDQQNGNFNWNSYAIESSGAPVSNYNLKRRDQGTGVETLVGSTTSNVFTDPQYGLYWPTNTKWFVDAIGFNCNPTAKVAAQKVKTKSNHANDKIITKINAVSFLNDVKIYPNPANSVLNIEVSASTNSTKDLNIKIMDVLGKEVLATEYQKQIDISHLSKGIYFVKITSGKNASDTKKLVVE
jgi:PKD repeat protein